MDDNRKNVIGDIMREMFKLHSETFKGLEEIVVKVDGDVKRGEEFGITVELSPKEYTYSREEKGVFEGLEGIDHSKLPEMKWNAHPIGLTTVYDDPNKTCEEAQRVMATAMMIEKRKLAGEYKVAMENCGQAHQKVSDLYLDLLEIAKSFGRDAGMTPQYRKAIGEIRFLMELIVGIQERWGNYVPLVGKFT